MFRTALTQLAALTVPGVVLNADVDAVPEALSRGQLPALLVLPIHTEADRLFSTERGGGFEALAFANSARSVTYLVNHLLLVAPTASGSGLRSHIPVLINLIDAYFAALSANPTLNASLHEPARVRVEPGVFRYGGVQYVGCAFHHQWLLSS
ncbi:MAG: hypothetical protein SF029_15060 [bacterium]|nr:hypothetical protein [bacterium]